jgi:C_GCAxxG_C_C family probable redox protein
MLRDYATKYYLEQHRNCAVSLLMAANEEYHLGLEERDFSLMAGFGGGMGCGGTCGALTGALAALGLIYPAVVDDASPAGIKADSARLVKEFEDALGSANCEELKAKYRTEASKCLETVLRGCDVLEKHVSNLKGEAAPKPALTPEQVKAVKGLGFLRCKGTDNFNCRVVTGNGKLDNARLRLIADAAQKFGNGEAAMTTRLTVEIQSVPYENIEPLRAYLQEGGLSTGGTGSKVRPVVCCKGTTCQYGLYDTYSLAEKIHKTFYEGWHDVLLPHKFKIALGGCPNNCVKPDLNDFGIVGQRAPGYQADLCRGCKTCAVEKSCPIGAATMHEGKLVIDEENCNRCGRCVGQCPFKAMPGGDAGFRIYIGGRWGKKAARGRALSPVFAGEVEVMAVLEKALLLFRDQGVTGERFADTIARLGFENVEAQLLGDDLTRRKDEILGAVKHTVGGATC